MHIVNIHITLFFFLFTGCQNDDSRSGNLRSVLATIPSVFHSDVILPRDNKFTVHPGVLLGHLLACHEQLHVQPHHLLLDERKVSTPISLSYYY